MKNLFKKVPFVMFYLLWKVFPFKIKMAILDRRIVSRLDFPYYKIFLRSTSSVSIQRLNSCKKEPETISWLHSNIKSDTIFYDIGANTGSYSLIAAKLMGDNCTGKVVSFEPVPSTFIELCENIQINKLNGRIIPMNVALNNKVEIIEFSLNSFDAGVGMHLGLGNNSILSNSDLTVFRYPIRTNTLDNIIQEFNLPIPNMLKLDVDGPEYNILLGARETLNDDRLKIIQIEIDEINQPLSEIMALLEGYNFVLIEKHSHGNPNIFDYVFVRKLGH